MFFEVAVLENILFRVHKDEMGGLLDAVESGCQDVFTVLDQHVRDHIKDTSENFANS